MQRQSEAHGPGPRKKSATRVADVFLFFCVRGEAGAAGAVPLALQAPARVAQMAAAAAHAAAAAGPHGIWHIHMHGGQWGGGGHCSEPGAAAQAAAAGSRAARMFFFTVRHFTSLAGAHHTELRNGTTGETGAGALAFQPLFGFGTKVNYPTKPSAPQRARGREGIRIQESSAER